MFPTPFPGQVIRYAYLWQSQHLLGQEEGEKNRPCAIVLTAVDARERKVVTVLPITHTPPSQADAALAIEIPHATKRRLGLDDARSWVMISEANQFVWPGPDLRMARNGEPESILRGEVPGHLLIKIRDAFVAARKIRKTVVVQRTE